MSRGHSAKGKGERNIGKGAEQKMKIILANKEDRERAEREIWHKITKPETEVCIYGTLFKDLKFLYLQHRY